MERHFRDATGNAIEDALAMELALGMCRSAESAVIASSGQDFAAATRMMSEAKAAIRRRMLRQTKSERVATAEPQLPCG